MDIYLSLRAPVLLERSVPSQLILRRLSESSDYYESRPSPQAMPGGRVTEHTSSIVNPIEGPEPALHMPRSCLGVQKRCRKRPTIGAPTSEQVKNCSSQFDIKSRESANLHFKKTRTKNAKHHTREEIKNGA